MTESLIKREHHSEITKSKVSRQKIIDAALKEFGQHGYEGASTNQICLSAGISKGLLYHYFKSKENLFAETLTVEQIRGIKDTGGSVICLSDNEALRDLCDHFIQMPSAAEELTPISTASRWNSLLLICL